MSHIISYIPLSFSPKSGIEKEAVSMDSSYLESLSILVRVTPHVVLVSKKSYALPVKPLSPPVELKAIVCEDD